MTEQMTLPMVVETRKTVVPESAPEAFFGTRVIYSNPFYQLPEDRKFQLWAECVEEWLASQKAENTRAAYRVAVRDFMASTDLKIWKVGPSEVSLWMVSMRNAGRSDATIAQKLAALSSLFEYAMTIKTWTLPDGSRKGICDFNPARAVERPEVEPYGKAMHLSKEQTIRLLRAIPFNTLHGKMHFALILGFLLTGRRSSEWSQMQWGRIWEEDGNVLYTYSNKGKKNQKYVMPPQVWEAVVDYLMAAGRFEHMQDEDYIFTAMTDRITRMTRAVANAEGQLVNEAVVGVDWKPGKTPISRHEVGRIVKMYAYSKGVGIKKIKPHWLRHTFTELKLNAGMSLQQLQKMLGHSNIATTMIYADKRETRVVDDTLEEMTAQLHLDSIMRQRKGLDERVRPTAKK